MNPKLAGKRPATAWLAAGNALNLTHEGAERQRIGEVAAYPALVIAKRRDRLDYAGQLARRPLPDEGGAVAKLGQRYLQSVERNGPVSPSDLARSSAKAAVCSAAKVLWASMTTEPV
jgi:hypothetical protein